MRLEDYGIACSFDPRADTAGDGHMMGLRVGVTMYSLPYVDMTFVAGLPHSTFSIRYQLSKCHVSSIFLDYCGRRFANEGLAIDYSSNAVSAYTINNKLAWPFYDDTVLWKAFEAASQIAGEAEELTNEGL